MAHSRNVVTGSLANLSTKIPAEVTTRQGSNILEPRALAADNLEETWNSVRDLKALVQVLGFRGRVHLCSQSALHSFYRISAKYS